MTETEFYESLWDRSRLLFTNEHRVKLRRATVAISGLGGVGCIIAEILVRSGIVHLKLADPGVYAPSDLNRQLYATTKTLGQNKAEVSKGRILEINPYCKVEVYTKGVQKENIFEILKGVDILCDQSDSMPQILIQHRAARKMGIPLVTGARAGYPGNRWAIQARVWNFRDNPETKTREEENKLWTCNLTWDELTVDVLNKIDQENLKLKEHKIREEILKGNTTTFGNVPQEYLLSELNKELFYKRTICAPMSNLAGILASIEVIKLLLGWKTTTYKLNLLEGYLEEGG